MSRKDLDWKVKESKKVLKAAVDKWRPNIGIAFTGRKDSTVVMHLLQGVTKHKIPAMFIDHGLHFDETLSNLSMLEKLWVLDIRRVANEDLLKRLNRTRTKKAKSDLVRELKIQTIKDCIKKFKWKALITAIRWDEQEARSDEKYFSKRSDHYRVHPILHFTEEDIWSYIRKHKIPYNPLYDQGYRSIGEKIFTKKTSKRKKDERSGREKDKEEVMKKLRSLGYF